MIEFPPPLSQAALREQGPLTLAYIGDCVYELLVRTDQLSRRPSKISHLHRRTTAQVRAATQSAAAKRLFPHLNEEEKAAFLRGRNAHTRHAPKGASAAEYAHATALEAVFGWLYLAGRRERLHELFALCQADE